VRTKETIVQGETEGKSFYEIIEANHTFGWRNFDQACLEAYELNLVSEESALAYCTKKGVVTRAIDRLKKIRGEHLTSTDLKMRREPVKTTTPAFPATLKLK
jgi:twitching motility protein PilT